MLDMLVDIGLRWWSAYARLVDPDEGRETRTLSTALRWLLLDPGRSHPEQPHPCAGRRASVSGLAEQVQRHLAARERRRDESSRSIDEYFNAPAFTTRER